MNNYVTLDGHKYHCPFREWEQQVEKSMNVRYAWGNTVDVTFGNGSFTTWTGALRANVTPETGFGSVSDIRNTMAKDELLTFIDHYGNTYTVVVQNNGAERSLSPRWDGASNAIFFPVKIYKVA